MVRRAAPAIDNYSQNCYACKMQERAPRSTEAARYPRPLRRGVAQVSAIIGR